MEKLSLFEQELNEMDVKIVEDENLGLCVSYRSLHKYCDIGTKKVDYFKRNVAKYFNENKDYTLLKIEKRVNGNGKDIMRYWINSFNTSAIEQLRDYYSTEYQQDKLKSIAKQEVKELINTLEIDDMKINITINN